MKVIITGADGMIGLYLTEHLLKSGYSVLATARTSKLEWYFKKLGAEFSQLDVTSPSDFLRISECKEIDAVIHLAGCMPATMEGYVPEKFIEVNTRGTLNVLEFCRKVGIKQIIFTQTHSDLAGAWDSANKNGLDPYSPYSLNYGNDHSVYVVSKVAAVELLKIYQQQFGIGYAVFRCPNIYCWFPVKHYYVDGKKRLIGYRKLIDQAMKSEAIEIWGDATVRKDIVYVKDLCGMIEASIQNHIQRGIYNVSTGVSTSLEEQIKGIIEVFSPKENPSKLIYRPDIKVKLNNHHYNIDNVVRDLKYHPKYDYIAMLMDMKKEMLSHRFDGYCSSKGIS